MRYLALFLVLIALPAQAEPTPQQRLSMTQQQLEAAKARQSDLSRQSEKLDQELKSLRSKLIKATSDNDQSSLELSETESSLNDLEGTAARRNAQLAEQRQQMASLVGMLQRLALTPPAAQLLSDTPPLDKLRANLQIKALLPALKKQSDELAATVADLRLLRQKLQTQRQRALAQQGRLNKQQSELNKLIAERGRLLESTRSQNTQAQAKATQLADQAKDLRELLDKMEREAKQRRAAAAAETASAALKPRDLPAGAARRLPVSAPAVTRFGEKDALGSISKGITLRPRPGATIAAPASGRVAFAGPFRGYGRVVILEHTGDFHSVMAGMGAISVEVGQQVAAGEPLGNLSDYREPIPELYFELRHNGTPVDPLGELAGRLTR